MVYAYIRSSTEKQSNDNQRYEILKFTDEKKLQVDKWLEENISGTKRAQDRKLGTLLQEITSEDILIVTELSRLGRSLMEVMHILHTCMENGVKVYTIKERYELGDNINSKVLAFAFSLSAEIERQMISQRTKEALARKKSEGKKLGRPVGRISKYTKLTGKEDEIVALLKKKVSISAIGRIFQVHRLTVESFINSRQLRDRFSDVTPC